MKLAYKIGGVVAAIALGGTASAATFVSEYTKTKDQYPPGVFATFTHEAQYCTDGTWEDYTALDATSPFFSFNASTNNDLLYILQGKSGVPAGRNYGFSALVANNYSVSPPVFQLMLDGALVGNVFDSFLTGTGTNFTNGLRPWNLMTLSFTAAKIDVFTFGIVDSNADFSGNDFSAYLTRVTCGLGYCIATVPEPTSWTMMILGFLGAGIAFRRKTNRLVLSA